MLHLNLSMKFSSAAALAFDVIPRRSGGRYVEPDIRPYSKAVDYRERLKRGVNLCGRR